MRCNGMPATNSDCLHVERSLLTIRIADEFKEYDKLKN